jgi:hypothetical protein
MKEKPPVHFINFIEWEYTTVRQWVHLNDDFINDNNNYPLSNQPIQVSFPDEDKPLSDEFMYLFMRWFWDISAWVRKNDELRKNVDTGSPYHRPRLMQTKFEDFLVLREEL